MVKGCLLLTSCLFQDFDPMAESRIPRVADRENDYQMKRRQLVISPERHDPFSG